MLIIENLSKRFKRTEVLHGINLKFNHGVYGILGENGAGKSTLMRCILGLYTDYSGKIIMEDFKKKHPIGYLPQNFDGLGELKVQELLTYFADMKDMKKKDISAEVDAVLERVNLLDKKNSKVASLSGGQRRRVGIAQTLLKDPDILIYDEPTTGLDPKERIRFGNIIEENKREKTIIISTHIVSDIEYMCDKIIVMKEGRVLGVFSPRELAALAEGKVYEVSEEVYNENRTDFLLIKKTLANDEFKMRIISEKDVCGEKVSATVEDGYLWASR